MNNKDYKINNAGLRLRFLVIGVSAIFIILATMTFTDELIEELISCQKEVVDSPKDSGISRGSKKRKFSLQSTDGKHFFAGFISENQTFQENFSIGLVYYPKDEKGNYVILRVNGPHGPNEYAPHHNGPHIHKATADKINAGLKPESGIILTDVPYTTVEDAIQYYVRLINIVSVDRNKYFPPPNRQADLFEGLF